MAAEHAGKWGPFAVQDISGNTLTAPGAVEVTIYESDGATPATLYSDRDRTTTVTDPTILDGMLEFYAEPGPVLISTQVGAETPRTFAVEVPVDAADVALRSAALDPNGETAMYLADDSPVGVRVRRGKLVTPPVYGEPIYLTADENELYDEAFDVTRIGDGAERGADVFAANSAGLIAACTLQDASMTDYLGRAHVRPIILPSVMIELDTTSPNITLPGRVIQGQVPLVVSGRHATIKLNGSYSMFATPTGPVHNVVLEDFEVRGAQGWTTQSRFLPDCSGDANVVLWNSIIRNIVVDFMASVIRMRIGISHIGHITATNLTEDTPWWLYGSDCTLEHIVTSFDRPMTWRDAWTPAVLMELSLTAASVSHLYLTPSCGSMPILLKGSCAGTSLQHCRLNGLGTIGPWSTRPDHPGDAAYPNNFGASSPYAYDTAYNAVTFKGQWVISRTPSNPGATALVPYRYPIWWARGGTPLAGDASDWVMVWDGVTVTDPAMPLPTDPGTPTAYRLTSWSRIVVWRPDIGKYSPPQFWRTASHDGWTPPQHDGLAVVPFSASFGADGPGIFYDNVTGPVAVSDTYMYAICQAVSSVTLWDGAHATYGSSGIKCRGTLMDATGDLSVGSYAPGNWGPEEIDFGDWSGGSTFTAAWLMESFYQPARPTQVVKRLNSAPSGFERIHGRKRVSVADHEPQSLGFGINENVTLTGSLAALSMLTYRLEPDAVYGFEGFLYVEGADNASDLQLSLVLPSRDVANFGWWSVTGLPTSATALTDALITTTSKTAAAVSLGVLAGATPLTTFRGVVSANAGGGGDLEIHAARVGSGTTTVYGASLNVTRIR